MKTTVNLPDELVVEIKIEAARQKKNRRLRGADALYAATAAKLGCALLSWDPELISRGGALSPRDWLQATRESASSTL